MLEVGQKAPDFSAQDSKGTTVALSQLAGKKVILYFYPKDDTPGCTKEAIGFTEALDSIAGKNAVVLGVSKDSTESHAKFETKYGLKIQLLADPEGKICEDYGVWREKKNYGRTYMGIVRTTVLIDEQGTIEKVWNNVKVDGHVEAVCATL